MAAFSDTSFDTSAFSVGAFDFGENPPPLVVDVPTQLVGGGFPAHGTLHLRRRDGRTKEDIARERALYGLAPVAAGIVASVAESQATRLEQDEHKRFEELLRELELRDIEFEAKHLEALNEQRQRLIDQEIAIRLRQMMDDEMVVLMLLAAAV